MTYWQKCFDVRSAVSLSSADEGCSRTFLSASCSTVAAAEMLTLSLPMYCQANERACDGGTVAWRWWRGGMAVAWWHGGGAP